MAVTVHSAFSLPIEHRRSATYVPLQAEKLRIKFKDIAYVIIDEISIVSCHNFNLVHKWLCEIKETPHMTPPYYLEDCQLYALVTYSSLNQYMAAPKKPSMSQI